MTTKILTIYENENKLHVWYNRKTAHPAHVLIQTAQTALNEPSVKAIEKEWKRADAHRENVIKKLLEQIVDLEIRNGRQEATAEELNRLLTEMRLRLIRQQDKINFLKTLYED